MLDKLKYALALFDRTEIFIFFLCAIAYHLIVVRFSTKLFRASASLRLRSVEAERDEYKRQCESHDVAWKDREEELRRALAVEREREVFQLKAEYDSYVGLLEQRLTRTKTQESGTT